MTKAATAIVIDGATVAASARVGDHVVIYPGAEIAEDCVLHGFTQVWGGIRIGHGASLGPGVVFDEAVAGGAIEIGAGARIGAGSVISRGVNIGAGAVVMPGSVVAQNVPPYAIVSGSPIRITGYVSTHALGLAREPEQFNPNFPPGQDSIRIGVGDVTLHRFKKVRDMRGDLAVADIPKDVPFAPQRWFAVFNVPSEKTRGEHAHYRCHQFLVCLHGSCAIVADDGINRTEVMLDSPDMGIYLPPLTWGIQYKYSADGVLLVFASDPYDPTDYIRDYADFVRVVAAKPA
ncbi:WxcM-like domain-containing protein [Ferrovibrio sp. MS7]|uniref:WxcM-like domain-containing protein n=1 Tax=Ferrovibrio plantarum TaxID=3119164 RepID=UPI003135FA15